MEALNLKIVFISILLFTIISISNAESELQNETYSTNNNSSIEQNIVIVIDASASTGDATTGITYNGLIEANAINMIQKATPDTRVGVVVYGGEIKKTDILALYDERNKPKLENFIRNIVPQNTNTPVIIDLDKGLLAAKQLLSSVNETKEIIVLSDGKIYPEEFQPTRNTAIQLKNEGIETYFVQILTSYEINKEPFALYNEFAQAIGGQVQVLNPDERMVIQKPKPILTPTVTPNSIPRVAQTATPTPIATPQLEQEVKELKERLNKVEEKQNQSWLKSSIDSILNWFKTVF